MMTTWMVTDGLTKWRISVERNHKMLQAHLLIQMETVCVTTSTAMMTMIHSSTQKKSCVTLIHKTNRLFQSMMITMVFVMLCNLIETLTDGLTVLKNPVALTQMMHPVYLLILMAT